MSDIALPPAVAALRAIDREIRGHLATFTTERPTLAGWYWVQLCGPIDRAAEIVHLEDLNDPITLSGSGWRLPLDWDDVSLWGPRVEYPV